jgi:hypothetical protein
MSGKLHTEQWEMSATDPDKAFMSDPSTIENELRTNASTEASNNSLIAFLLSTAPQYIEVVPNHWLKQDLPSYNVQTIVAILFLAICIPANIGQILIFVAYGRYNCFFYMF